MEKLLLNQLSDHISPEIIFFFVSSAAECATFSIKIGITAIINKLLRVKCARTEKKGEKHFYYKKLLTMDLAFHVSPENETSE